MPNTAVRIKEPDGTWVNIGEGSGAWPEQVNVSSNHWGPDTARFTIKRIPEAPLPELKQFADVEVLENGVVIWEGYVWEAQSSGRQTQEISVDCRGWQYKLDDDIVQHVWVHSNMGDWRDGREHPNLINQYQRQMGTVDVSDTSITLGQAQGTTMHAGNSQAVYIDFGDHVRVRRIQMMASLTNVAGNGTFRFYARGRLDGSIGTGLWGDPTGYWTTWSGAFGPEATEPYLIQNHTAAENPIAGDFLINVRQVALFFYWVTGAGSAAGADYEMKISDLQLFGESSSYHRNNWPVPILRADDAIREAVRYGAPDLVVPDVTPDPGASMAEEIDLMAMTSQFPAQRKRYRLASTAEAAGGTAITLGTNTTLNNAGGPLTHSEETPSVYAFTNHATGGLFTADPFTAVASRNAATYINFFRTTSPHTATVGSTGPFGVAIGSISSRSAVGLPAAGQIAFTARVINSAVHFGNWWVAVGGGSSEGMYAYMDSSVGFTANDGQWHMYAFARDVQSGYTLHWLDGWYTYSIFKPGVPYTFGLHWGTVSGHGAPYTGDLAEINLINTALGDEPLQSIYRHALNRSHDTGFMRTYTDLGEWHAKDGRTPRDLMETANTHHRQTLRIDRGRQVGFKPRPSVPKYKLAPAAAARFEHSLLGAPDEVYNRVIVTGTDFDGKPVRVMRDANSALGTDIWTPHNATQLPNPTFNFFDIDDWHNSHESSGGTGYEFARNTSIYHTAPASIKYVPPTGGSSNQIWSWYHEGAEFRRRTYRLTFWYRYVNAAAANNTPGRVTFGLISEDDMYDISFGWQTSWAPTGTWQYGQAVWTPRQYVRTGDINRNSRDGTAGVMIQVPPTGMYLDSFVVETAEANALDRLNQDRVHTMEVGFEITTEIATKLADAFLIARSRLPFRGQTEVRAGELLDYFTGAPVPLNGLIYSSHELAHFGSMIDPDTGDLGRDGAIVSSSYTPGEASATISIDSNVESFEALLSRLEMVSGRRR